MSDLLPHLLKANLALVLFYLGYQLGLRKLTFYETNRFYLLFALVFSATFPFLDLNELFTQTPQIRQEILMVVPNWEQLAITDKKIGISELARILFWATAAMMTLRLFIKLIGVFRIHAGSTPARWTTYTYRSTPEIASPFSFWKRIYLNPLNHSEDQYEQIFKHESVHVRQLHTLDILISEIAMILFWYNPIAWQIRYAIAENIEFITDKNVIASGIDKQSYQYSLVNFCAQSFKHPVLGNHFNLKNLKRRIIMMNKKETSTRHLGKYAIIVPAVVLGSLTFNVSGAHENPAEASLLRPVPAAALQDTNKFKNLESIEFKIQNSEDPSFGKTVSNEDALVLLDGEEITKKKMNSIDPNTIKEICVYKGEHAIKLYGAKGKDGVILITSKKAEGEQD